MLKYIIKRATKDEKGAPLLYYISTVGNGINIWAQNEHDARRYDERSAAQGAVAAVGRQSEIIETLEIVEVDC
jgi:hypothetical protein